MNSKNADNEEPRIERSIYLTSSQRYRVRVRRRKGSDVTVERVVDDFNQARVLRDEAARIRADDGDVRAEWDRQLEKVQRLKPTTVAQAARSYTTWKASHVTPRTMRSIHGVINAMILPTLGHLYVHDVDLEVVRGWMQQLIDPERPDDFPYMKSTQDTALSHLRNIVQQVPSRHAEFPWSQVKTRKPNRTRRPRPQPEKWGGNAGDLTPAPTFTQVAAIGRELHSAGRVVPYMQTTLSLRRGEAMGVDNSDFYLRVGRLWVDIRKQRDLRTGEALDGCKGGEPGQRKLPLPEVLARYIESYWDRYHDGYRPGMGPDHPRHKMQLAVTATGRDLDGSFMSATPNYLTNHLLTACARADYGYEDVGYRLRPHDFRRICPSYLMNRNQVLQVIDQHDAASDTSGKDRFQILYEMLAAREGSGPTDADISRWLGHALPSSAADNTHLAANVTISHYVRQLSSSDLTSRERSMIAISDLVNRIITFEIGSFPDDPDPQDSYVVVSPADENWMTLAAAEEKTGIAGTTFMSGIRSGIYSSELCWYADGERKPPGPRHLMRRVDVERVVDRRDRANVLPKYIAAKQLGVSPNMVDRLIRDGHLAVRDRTGSGVYVDTAEVDALQQRILSLVAACFGIDGSSTSKAALARFRKGDTTHEMQRELDLFLQGCTYADIERQTGTSANTVRTRARRERWIDRLTDSADTKNLRNSELDTQIHAIFLMPYRIHTAMWDRWVVEALDAKLLIKAGNGRFYAIGRSTGDSSQRSQV